MSRFQIILIGIFVVSAIVGVVVFATFKGFGGGDAVTAPVAIWGTVSDEMMQAYLQQLKTTGKDFEQVTYRYVDPRVFDQQFINALASGKGPDLILIDQSSVVTHEDKLFVIPYKNYSERIFASDFIDEGKLFTTPEGILGLPLSVDPLVLYYNKDILTNEGIPNPPKYWNDVVNLASSLTILDGSKNITRSTIALGDYQNILHAKDILSLLILQAGNSIVIRDNSGIPISVLATASQFGGIAPAESAVRFYTEFSNPVKSVYSWNRAFANSRQAFISGDLVFYIGYGSELQALKAANPNLNFDMIGIPQLRDSNVKMTFGNIKALAIPKASQNIAGAYTIASLLTSSSGALLFSQMSGLPPVRRDLLSNPPTDTYGPVLYQSALMSRAWLDPNAASTEQIFKKLIESTVSGEALLEDAIKTADDQLQVTLEQ